MGRGPGIRATSASSIQIDFVYKGVRCRERIRLAPTPRNLKYAQRLKATIDHEIATNTFDYAKHFPDSPRARRYSSEAAAGVLLSKAMTDYLDTLEGAVEPETLKKYRHDAEIVAGWFDAQKSLADLTRSDVRLAISKQNLSRKRILNLLTPLRGALQQAFDDGLIPSNPLHGFKLRRVEAPKEAIDPFTPEEIAALGKTELGYLWTFWAWTGVRTGELIALQWRDISKDGATVHIERAVRVGREKVPKTDAGKRVIQLLPASRKALKALKRREPGDHVFTNPNTGAWWYEDRALARAFRKACEAAEVRYRYPYQLRHTFATWALSSGENPAWIARYMGH